VSYCECDFDDVLTVLDERTVKAARKDHKCSECSRTIKAGESYESVFGLCDGDGYTYRTCSHCLALRDWIKAHIPCFCWAYTCMREYAMETAYAAAHEAPGLLFGTWRREIAIRRARQAQRGAS
jgi:hypothetical protein